MDKIRVAIIGVGNCASSLVQGAEYYKNAKETDFIPGVMHVNLGGYHIRDIEFVAAFDIDRNKVGKDLSEAIFIPPNNTTKFADVPYLNVKVERGMTHDGLGKYLSQIIKKAPGATSDVVGILKESKTDVAINYCPVGSEEATKWYVEQVLEAGCALINCIPVFIASEKYWQRRFERKKLPIIGDDIKSQVGATILHRTLVNLYLDRGMPIDRTYQLNTGGNTDFLNMLERERLASKKKSKTNAVTSQIKARGLDIHPDNIHVGPSDYVPWQDDNKVCFLRMEGEGFGRFPFSLELRLSVEDSPNSAGMVIDAIRFCRIARSRGDAGPLFPISAYTMKHPPKQMPEP
ncbi:MAG: inositol-3-phosphate synthase, partial [Candidatus Aminicenantales bacterium]